MQPGIGSVVFEVILTVLVSLRTSLLKKNGWRSWTTASTSKSFMALTGTWDLIYFAKRRNILWLLACSVCTLKCFANEKELISRWQKRLAKFWESTKGVIERLVIANMMKARVFQNCASALEYSVGIVNTGSKRRCQFYDIFWGLLGRELYDMDFVHWVTVVDVERRRPARYSWECEGWCQKVK